MRILQYEGVSRLSQSIRFFTWNRTTHTAVEFDDGRVCEAWRSREQDGVRIVESLHAQHTPGTIVKAYTIPELTPLQSALFTAWLIGQEGKPYAFWGGITRFITRRDPQPYDPQTFRIESYDPKNWFCSCLAFAGLMHVKFNLLDRIPPWRVSPGHINLSPRLRLDEVISVAAGADRAKLPSAGGVPAGRGGFSSVAAGRDRGTLSSDLRPLSSDLSSEPGRACSPSAPLSAPNLSSDLRPLSSAPSSDLRHPTSSSLRRPLTSVL